MRTILPLAAVLSLLAPAVPGAQTGPASGPRPPNIVLIVADDLGYGDLGVYGHPTIKTPRLDRLAAEGVKLTSYYAAEPVCSASRFSLLTGRYSVRAGITGALMPGSRTGIAAAETTLAEVLKAAGYRTGIVGKWHLGDRPGHLPTEHGFDSYFGLLYSNDMIPPWVQTDVPLRLYRGLRPLDGEVDNSALTGRYTAEALSFIRDNQAAPFFLYLAHSMPHVPLGVPASIAGRSAGGRYGDVIEMLDWSTGEVLDELARSGLERETLVIFTSDNGPWMEMPARMFADSRIVPTDAGSAGPLRGSKATSWEGGTRVPFLARWPGRIPAGSVSSELVTGLDVLPTVAAAAGGRLPARAAIDGVDVRAVLEGKGPSPRDSFVYFSSGSARPEGIRDTRWKLRLTFPEQGAPVEALYDLSLDPAERFDVLRDHPDIAGRLRERLRQFAASLSR
ncbi:MAG TPA: sulfatase [Vicinamibacterales bacterium]|nr:sulfatase [Vicinamibacterales bacterium]HPW19527.1 sulfatase [Vicinamibacterales bacterium]